MNEVEELHYFKIDGCKTNVFGQYYTCPD